MQSIRRDDIVFRFEMTEGDKTAVVLVHGWCCDHTYLLPQFEHYRERGHRVLAVDLRGHGQSDKPVQRYTIPGFSDDVAWLCRELGFADAILIGHSMGGIVAFDLAVRYPELATAVVMIDSAVVVAAENRPGMNAFLEGLRGPDYSSALAHYLLSTLILPTDDRSRAMAIVDGMATTPQHVIVSAFEGLLDFDPEETGLRLGVPSLFIAASEPKTRSDMVRLQALVPGVVYGHTVGSGHFCQLEVPEQVNAMIDRFMLLQVPVRQR